MPRHARSTGRSVVRPFIFGVPRLTRSCIAFCGSPTPYRGRGFLATDCGTLVNPVSCLPGDNILPELRLTQSNPAAIGILEIPFLAPAIEAARQDAARKQVGLKNAQSQIVVGFLGPPVKMDSLHTNQENSVWKLVCSAAIGRAQASNLALRPAPSFCPG